MGYVLAVAVQVCLVVVFAKYPRLIKVCFARRFRSHCHCAKPHTKHQAHNQAKEDEHHRHCERIAHTHSQAKEDHSRAEYQAKDEDNHPHPSHCEKCVDVDLTMVAVGRYVGGQISNV